MYVSKTQDILADTFDYAINVFNISSKDFVSMFVVSSFSKRIEKGDLSIILGRSGIELVMDIYQEIALEHLSVETEFRFNRTVAYWIGWALAYYQWYSYRTFEEIFKVFSYENLEKMYYSLHEADVIKLVDIVDERVRELFSGTNLKRIRKNAGLKQTELAELSGVNVRSIQMYEQRKNDINKASFETVYRLSKALGCDVESLFEN